MVREAENVHDVLNVHELRYWQEVPDEDIDLERSPRQGPTFPGAAQFT